MTSTTPAQCLDGFEKNESTFDSYFDVMDNIGDACKIRGSRISLEPSSQIQQK